MEATYIFVLVCGAVALLYGVFASRSIMAVDAGNERMREIAGAIQEGAQAYLNRQYLTIAIVGVVVAAILLVTLGAMSPSGSRLAPSVGRGRLHWHACFGAGQCADHAGGHCRPGAGVGYRVQVRRRHRYAGGRARLAGCGGLLPGHVAAFWRGR